MKYILIIISFVIFTFNSFGNEIKTVKLLDLSSNKYSDISIEKRGQSVLIFLGNHPGGSHLKEVKEVAGIDAIGIKLDRFLKIVFRLRGGSGEHLRLTKIFCISGGNFRESLSLSTSEISYLPSGVLEAKYGVAVKILHRKGEFVASLNESYTNNGIAALNKNHLLEFDANKGIFYSQKNKGIAIKIPGIKGRIKEYYGVLLSKNKYIFYKDFWYQEERNSYKKI